MSRIYLSGPISDNPDYKKDFLRAEKSLVMRFSDKDWIYSEIINPVRVAGALPVSFSYEDYMTIDMILLTKCDAIYMISGYEKSKGALAELLMAKSMGLEIYYESEEQENGEQEKNH